MDWGKGIALSIAAFIIIILTLVTISVRMDGIELVTENYYEQEINYQQQIDKEASTLALGKEVLQFDAAKKSLILDLPEGSEGVLNFFRPSDLTLDQRQVLSISEAGKKSVYIGDLKAGYWRVQLSWEEGGKSFYQEKKITL